MNQLCDLDRPSAGLAAPCSRRVRTSSTCPAGKALTCPGTLCKRATQMQRIITKGSQASIGWTFPFNPDETVSALQKYVNFIKTRSQPQRRAQFTTGVNSRVNQPLRSRVPGKGSACCCGRTCHRDLLRSRCTVYGCPRRGSFRATQHQRPKFPLTSSVSKTTLLPAR